MPFKKGHKKIGGKVKGTPNKKHTILEALEEIVTEDGTKLDAASVVKLFFDALMTQPPFQRVDALLEFMQYIYPKQKMLEIGNKDGEGFRIEIVDYGAKK